MHNLTITGIHHLKFPITDLTRSKQWFENIFRAQVLKEFEDDDGVVRGLNLLLPAAPGTAPLALSLRLAPEAVAIGFDPVSLAVADRGVLAQWQQHFEELAADYRKISDDVIAIRDPDGTEIRFFSVAVLRTPL